MLYQICNGAVRFGAATVLEKINFEIRNTEKIAVVGRNGCGKTTLLRLIAGEIDLSKRDSDAHISIARAGDPQIGYLRQVAFQDEAETLENEVQKAFAPLFAIRAEIDSLAAAMKEDAGEAVMARYARLQGQFETMGGYTWQKEYETVLRKFGFTDADKKKSISQFSGGQRTKIAFAKMLLGKPDILLLDEPTNHLDIDTISWLEGYLRGYDRAVVIVSHDRMFLDRIVDVVYEIEHHTATRYPGNYSAFVKRKQLNWEKQRKDYTAQQKEIKRLQALADRFKAKPTKASMAHAKLKQIEHMQIIDAPAGYDRKSFRAAFSPTRENVTDALAVDKLQIGYDRALAEVTFQQKKGQKIGVIGDNGVGKSTLLRTLAGQHAPLGGRYAFGAKTDLGYFEQQMAQHSSGKAVLDDFWDAFPTLTQLEARSALGAFLFSGDDVFKKVDMLSGGEKVRLALAKIMMQRPNFLMLDEPTNHMDIIGKESLEELLTAYTGTVLFVSHDRYFVNKIADSLLVFEGEKVQFYPYGYGQYIEDCQRQEDAGPNAPPASPAPAAAEPKREGAPRGRYSPAREKARNQKRMEKLEGLIAEREKRVAELHLKSLEPELEADYVELMALHQRQAEETEALHALMREWEALCDAAAE